MRYVLDGVGPDTASDQCWVAPTAVLMAQRQPAAAAIFDNAVMTFSRQ